jgi:hypothetical protein
MIRYKEEIPDHVRGESARDGLPAALEHKRMLMGSRAPFGQNLFDFDCSCMFWLPFRVEAKLGLSKRASVPAVTALNENCLR